MVKGDNAPSQAFTAKPGSKQIPGMPKQCTATNKHTGRRCHNDTVVGMRVCRLHGGAASQSKRAAKVRISQHEAGVALRKLGVPVTAEPREVLLDQVYLANGMRLATMQMAEQIDPTHLSPTALAKDRHPAQATVDLMAEWSDRAARVSKMALDAGIEDRMVKLAERQSEAVVLAIRTVIFELGLPDDQKQLAFQIAARALRELTDSTPIEAKVVGNGNGRNP